MECDCISINASQDESLGGRTVSTEEQSWHRKPLVQPGHELKIENVWIQENIYRERESGEKKPNLHPHGNSKFLHSGKLDIMVPFDEGRLTLGESLSHLSISL